MRHLWSAGAALAAALATAPPPACAATPDHEFVVMVLRAGRAEVAMSSLAQKRGQAMAVRIFGRWMASDHTAMNELLGPFAEDGDNIDEDADQRAELDSVQKRQGADFDAAYVAAQVDDHVRLIEVFKREAEVGIDKRLVVFARHLLPLLQQHLAGANELTLARSAATGQTTGNAAGAAQPVAGDPAKSQGDPAVAKAENKEGLQQLKVEGK